MAKRKPKSKSLGAASVPSEPAVTDERAQQWVQGWKIAGPVMQRMRDERLRMMDDSAGAKMLGATEQGACETPEANGLAIWQGWMMRLRLQQLTHAVGTTHQ